MSVINSIFPARALFSGVLMAVILAAVAVAQAASEPAVQAVEGGTNGALWSVTQEQILHLDGEAQKSFALPEAARGSASLSLAVGADNTLYLAGEEFGVLQSRNYGETWQSSGKGLPDAAINAVAAHSTLADIAYAYSPGQGMYRTEDAGKSWARIDAGPQEPVETFLHSNLPGSMETGWLFAGTERGVARSMDCFCFWGDAGDLRGKVTALAYDPKAPENVYAATTQALYHSADGGETWSALVSPPDSATDLAVADGQLYAATAQGLFLRTGGGWEKAID